MLRSPSYRLAAPRIAILAWALLLIAIIAGVFACNRKDDGAAAIPCCDPNAEPIFLESKLDDDDGDGNIYDEDFPTINDEDDEIADHTWIQDDSGLFHLFFHTEGLYTGSTIEHYTTSDLVSLDYVGTVLQPDPSAWDSHGLWAPHVIKSGDIYYMFYTGVTAPGKDPSNKQRIGLATSPDLMTWTRYPVNRCPGTSGDGCIYECNESWTTWDGPEGAFNQQCRDAFVIRDEADGVWLMMVTARSTNGYGVVTAAHSDDLVQWSGAGYLDATRRLPVGTAAQTTGGQAENPFITSHDGINYLLFTDWQDPEDSVSVQNPRTIAQYATSPTLDVDSTGSANWTYRGYIPDPAVNAIEVQRIGINLWVMSQSISNQRSGLDGRRRQLRLKCMVWLGGYRFDTENAVLPCGPALRAWTPAAPGAANP